MELGWGKENRGCGCWLDEGRDFRRRLMKEDAAQKFWCDDGPVSLSRAEPER